MVVHSVLHLIMYLMPRVKHPLYIRNRHTIVTIDRLWSSISMLQALQPPSCPRPYLPPLPEWPHGACRLSRISQFHSDLFLAAVHSIRGEASERLCTSDVLKANDAR